MRVPPVIEDTARAVYKWRTDVHELIQRGTALEQIADYLGLPDPFEVTSYGFGLHWSAWNVPLHDFTERVRDVARCLKLPPAEIEDIGTSSGVDLYARWRVELPEDRRWPDVWRVRITVASWSPKECKLDPQAPVVPAQYARIHPECRHTLEGLGDELENCFLPHGPDDTMSPSTPTLEEQHDG